MTTIQDILKEFDEKFELESQGCSECGGYELIDNEEIRHPKGKYHCEYDLDKVKDFISNIITFVQKDAEENALKGIQKIMFKDEMWAISNNQDLKTLVQQIKDTAKKDCKEEMVERIKQFKGEEIALLLESLKQND